MIKDNAKKILQYLLEHAIACGDLNNPLVIQYDNLANELHFESESLCRICCQYLNQLGYINITTDNDKHRYIRLMAKGIDFLESI